MKKPTAADREKLKELTRKAWARIMARALGGEALSLAERAELGDVDAEIPVIEHAAMEGVGVVAGHPGANLEEEYARLHALEHAGERLRAVADRAADAYFEIIEAAAVREKTAEAAATNETPKHLAAELRRATADTMRDWDRVAVSELQDAHNEARARAIKEHHGEDDPEVFKQPAPDACSWCRKLHIGPDGNPRIFRLSTLIAHGDNTGRAKPDWEAVVGITHPYCQCELFYIAPGWGFDEDGELVPGGTGGIRYSDETELQKAIAYEAALQKAALIGGDIEIAGIPVRIEANVGDAREWRGGRTVLRHAYGEIPGTRGVDGEPVDVYVGPDMTAPFAFAVDQRRPDGSFDEQKLFLGFRSPNEVEASYKFHYPEEFWGGVTQMTMEELWGKLVEADPDGMLKAGEDYRFRRDRASEREARGWVSNAPAMHNDNSTQWHAQPPTSANVTVAENLRRQKSTKPRLMSILPYNRPEAMRPGASVKKLQLQSERTHMEPEQMTKQVEANARQLDERIENRRKNSQPDVNVARYDQKFPTGPSPTDG